MSDKNKKSLSNSDTNTTKSNVKDLVTWGNGDKFKLISKASSQKEGWMKSTKAMEIPEVGCVVQVTTQQGDNIAEALTFVPGVCLSVCTDTEGKVVDRSLIPLAWKEGKKESSLDGVSDYKVKFTISTEQHELVDPVDLSRVLRYSKDTMSEIVCLINEDPMCSTISYTKSPDKIRALFRGVEYYLNVGDYLVRDLKGRLSFVDEDTARVLLNVK